MVAVRISNTTGDITVTEPLDPWLTTAQASELAGVTAGSWRSLVKRGYVPAPDDPGDLTADAHRRNPRWRRSTVHRYMATRKNARGKRNDKGSQDV